MAIFEQVGSKSQEHLTRREIRVTLLSALVCVLALASGFSCVENGPEGNLHDASRNYASTLPVFPGAEGFGTDTLAGRGGTVIRVTSLAADGPGSLREACRTTGPRVIVFEVGGIIDLRNKILLAEPYVTIAGQTAPSPGITLVGAGLIVQTHDVLVQHIRFRPGDRLDGPNPENRDGIEVIGRREGGEVTYNVVIDHCSISWAIDEGTSTWYRGVHDITFRHCIISENLSSSLHPKGEHSKGLLIGDHSKRVAVIGNLFAHNTERNPLLKGDVSALIVNNLIYNPGRNVIHLSDPEGAGPSLASIVGNVFISGIDTPEYATLIGLSPTTKSGTRIYETDSLPPIEEAPPGIRVDGPDVWVSPLTIHGSGDVTTRVLAGAGARPWDRDSVDRRVIQSVQNRTGRIIDSQEEVGGFPSPESAIRPLTLPENPNGDDDSDGYSNLEAWLLSFVEFPQSE